MTVPAPSNGLVRQDVTKIVATLGPSSSDPAVIRRLLEAGVNVVRINFSHGTHEKHAQVIATVRALAEELRLPVAILGDLQGPRIRIGVLPEPMELTAGQRLTLVHESQVGAGEIPVTYDHIADDVRAGATILINDGLLDLQVDRVEGARVHCTVRIGGRLSSNKGMNLPGIEVSAPSLTEKDRADITFAIAQDLDYLALSFVRRPEDIAALRALLPTGMLIVAKIEKDSALERIEEILQATDAVMVARGDLGVDLPYTKVPAAQRSIYRRCREHGIPVVCATEMMQSMIHSTRPTRAEVGDVEAVIRYGYDALVFTAETAMGKHPVLVIETAAAIRSVTEANYGPTPEKTTQTDAALAYAAAAFADRIGADRIVALTAGGHTAKLISGARSSTGVIAVSPDPHIVRRIGLYHGIKARTLPRNGGVEENAATTLQHLVENGDIEKGATCVLIGSRVGPDHAADIMMVRNA